MTMCADEAAYLNGTDAGEEAIRDLMQPILDAKDARIAELEAIVRSQSAMLEELAATAGFGRGDTYSAFSIIDALRRQGRVSDDGRSAECA